MNIEHEVVALRVSVNALVGAVEAQAEAVKDIAASVSEIKESLAKYRGFLAGSALVLGSIPAALVWLKSVLVPGAGD